MFSVSFSGWTEGGGNGERRESYYYRYSLLLVVQLLQYSSSRSGSTVVAALYYELAIYDELGRVAVLSPMRVINPGQGTVALLFEHLFIHRKDEMQVKILHRQRKRRKNGTILLLLYYYYYYY